VDVASITSSVSLNSHSSDLVNRTMYAEDRVRAIIVAENFEDAVRFLIDSRPKTSDFTPRGSLKYRFDTEPNAASASPSSNPPSTTSRPNLANFSSAVYAITRSKPYYTAGEKNCYWFANAMMFILSKHFLPSEPIASDKKQGTWHFGRFTLSLGGLEEDECDSLLNKYSQTMQDLGVTVMPYKTEQEIAEERARAVLDQQLQDYNQLASKAKDKLDQAAKDKANAETMHAKAETRVEKAKSKAKELAREAQFEEREKERLEQREKERLEALAKAEQREKEHLEALEALAKLQKQVDELTSSK